MPQSRSARTRRLYDVADFREPLLRQHAMITIEAADADAMSGATSCYGPSRFGNCGASPLPSGAPMSPPQTTGVASSSTTGQFYLQLGNFDVICVLV